MEEDVQDEQPHHGEAARDLAECSREQTHGGSAVVATLHDPTIAARYADRVVLLHGDGRWLAGPAHEVLTAANLSALYLVPVLEAQVAGRRVFVNA